MNKPPLVSVVIPCFNRTKYLFEAISSIRAQSYSETEIVLVNDGVTCPQSLTLLEKAAQQVDRYIVQPNLGLPAARNAGFRASRGTCIVPLDSDDRLEPDFIAACAEMLARQPDAAFAYSDCSVFGLKNYIERLHEYNLYRLLDRNVLTYAALIRREDWERASGYDETMRLGNEDWEFWLRLGSLGRFGSHVAGPLFRYRKHGPSLFDVALAHHENITSYIHARHPELYSQEGRGRIKARWAPSVGIIRAAVPAAPGDPDGQTLLDCFVFASGDVHQARPLAYLNPGNAPLDRNSAELAALAIWAGKDGVELPDGSFASSMPDDSARLSPAAMTGSHSDQQRLPAIPEILHRHLLNAGLLSWDSWSRHPVRSLLRLVPLGLKEEINRLTGRQFFDLSFYLQFRPRSLMLGGKLLEPVDYIPVAGQKRRVALITPHLGPGGAETVLYDAAGSLDRREFEIFLIAVRSRDNRWRERWKRVADHIYDLGALMPEEHAAAAIYSIVRNWKYDFVVMQNALEAYSVADRIREAVPAARILDLVHSVDDDWSIAAATAPVSSVFDMRIAVSEATANHLREHGTPAGNVRVIRNGIDIQRFRFTARRPNSSRRRILFAARLDPVKRPLLLVEIAAAMRKMNSRLEFRIVVAGDGPEEEPLRRNVAREGLGAFFEFRGHVPDLAPLLADTDVLVLTSRNEGVPLVVLESMACGVPVVCSNVGALSEVVRNNTTGLLIEVGSGESERFADAICTLLDAPERCSQMGHEGRLFIEKHHTLKLAQQAWRDVFPSENNPAIPPPTSPT